MSALVGVDSLQVAYMSDNVILINYTIATEHVTAISSNLKCLTAVVTLEH